MATSIDGYIATKNWDSDWILEPDFEYFDTICDWSDAIIIWNTTFKQYKWEIYPIPSKPNLIISKESQSPQENTHFYTSPEEAIKDCKKLGHDNIMLVWWWHINGSFLSKWLINEIIIDVQPIILGTWIKLFEQIDTLIKLECLSHEKLKQWLHILKYKVK